MKISAPIGLAEVGAATQLLIDDHVIDDVWLVRRVPETPAKHPGNPLPIAPSLYDADEKLFKAWYPVFAEDPEDDPGNEALYARAYAVSTDGFEWHKPELGIVERDGSTRNNLIDTRAMRGEFGVALKDPHDPDPRKRYKGTIKRWYHHVDPDRRGGGRLFAAYSADGIDWRLYPGDRSIIRDSNDGNGCFLYDERIGRYVNFRRPTILAGPHGQRPADVGFPEVEADAAGLYRHPEAEDYLHRYLRAAPYVDTRAAIGAADHAHEGMGCNRRIARAESDDFAHWTEPEVIIRPDELDPPRLYGIDVVVCEGVYLGLLQVFNKWGVKGYLGDPQAADVIDVQLTFSRDGFRWERLANRPVFIPRGVIGSWDGGMIAGARIIEYGDEVRFYYSGHSGSHNAALRTSGTGLATLPKGRFVARAAFDELGVLITKPFRLAGDRLRIDADASRGRIKVEVADAIGAPLPGLTVSDCRPLERDGARLPVTWNGGGTLRDRAGQVVRLRFYLYRAKLYSFTVEASRNSNA